MLRKLAVAMFWDPQVLAARNALRFSSQLESSCCHSTSSPRPLPAVLRLRPVFPPHTLRSYLSLRLASASRHDIHPCPYRRMNSRPYRRMNSESTEIHVSLFNTRLTVIRVTNSIIATIHCIPHTRKT
ncbi:hypothetical protein DFH09DRAFT_210114 [Mycena vulgaris]|nr:hypothetical protein DFH09DRAFT_210114 [Mycena vulgaris]